MITKLEQMKLEYFQKRFGKMGANEALNLAIDAEYFCNACGPFDVAFPRFKREQLDFETYALLIEKAGEQNK